MRLRICAIALPAAVALLWAPAAIAERMACPQAQPTAASYDWDFHGEATELIAEVEAQSAEVETLSDALAYSSSGSAAIHARLLNDIRNRVNAMGDTLCRLQAIRRVALPWQQQAIDRIPEWLREMATNTESAIEFHTERRADLFNREYRDYARDIYSASGELSDIMENFQEYARAAGDASRLARDLEIGPAS